VCRWFAWLSSCDGHDPRVLALWESFWPCKITRGDRVRSGRIQKRDVPGLFRCRGRGCQGDSQKGTRLMQTGGDLPGLSWRWAVDDARMDPPGWSAGRSLVIATFAPDEGVVG